MNYVKRSKPSNVQITEMYLFNHEFERTFPLSRKVKLKYFLIDSNGAFISYKEPKSLIKEKSICYRKSLLNLILYFLKSIFKGDFVLVYSTSVWFTDGWSAGYFHWMFDALPRLLESEVKKEIKIFLPSHFNSQSYVKASLEAMGFYNIQFMQANKSYFFKHLIFNTHSAPTGNYNEKTVRQLREICVSKLKGDSINIGERIFVSRAKAERRKIINESDLHSLLINFGFSIIYFEEYSWNEQVLICSKAKCLIGLHGAGLSNMLFMPEKSVILEFRRIDDSHNNCYFSLASALGHSYYYLQCNTNAHETLNANFMVDKQTFKELLEIIFNTNP